MIWIFDISLYKSFGMLSPFLKISHVSIILSNMLWAIQQKEEKKNLWVY